MGIPLSPAKGGGMCIPGSTLQMADLIVSSGKGLVSAGIKAGQGFKDVSHAALYAGGGEVVEAVGEGVLRRPLAQSLHEHDLAVAYRVRDMNSAAARKVVDLASEWAKQKRKYDTVGAFAAGSRTPLVCITAGGIICLAAQAGLFKSSVKFYCSQLVLEAYRLAGVSFIDTNPNTSRPQDIVNAYSTGKLIYVGHLIAGREDRTGY